MTPDTPRGRARTKRWLRPVFITALTVSLAAAVAGTALAVGRADDGEGPPGTVTERDGVTIWTSSEEPEEMERRLREYWTPERIREAVENPQDDTAFEVEVE
ncbi:hypothetical protein [Streptomyces sp. NPDC003077]|uniref:hypothetical protein n=1 Tax=Streptomyces sp. NPDC003077 TaxID=3154443 RepID=UPI0033BCD1D2